MARESWLPALWGSRELDPFTMLRRQIDDIFNDAGLSPSRVAPATLRGMFSPQIDVCETEKDWTITAELPGLEQNDIDVTMSGDVLTIRGEKHHEFEEGTPSGNGQREQQAARGRQPSGRTQGRAQDQGPSQTQSQDQSQDRSAGQPQAGGQPQGGGSTGVIPTGQHTQGRNVQRREESGRVYHRVERSWGSFQRSIRVPFEIDPDRVEAKFKNGILTITIPKPEEAQQQVRKIEIRGEA